MKKLVTPTYLNEKRKEIHEWNKQVGWWDNNPCKFMKGVLGLTEMAEAVEGKRNDDKVDDHLPHYKMWAVELADWAIRSMDLEAACGFYDKELTPTSEFPTYENYIQSQLDVINEDKLGLGEVIWWAAVSWMTVMGAVIAESKGHMPAPTLLIFVLAKFTGVDLLPIIEEKLEYNKKRADHTRENREKVGGKKF